MMDHYEAIDKHALRDKRIFQVTYFVNLVLLLVIVIFKMVNNTPPVLNRYFGWVGLVFFINLIVLATHYPNYRLWIRSWPRRILLITLIIGIATIISLTFLNQPTTIPTDVSSSAYSAQAVQGYLAGAKIGIAMRIILGTLSTIFIVFGSEDILDKN